MSMRRNFLQSNFVYTAASLLLAVGITCGCGQQGSTAQLVTSHGIPEDWSTHHVKFSDPGSETDAIRKGTHDQWLRIVNDPRYQMQQLRRSPAWSQRFKRVGQGPKHGQGVNDPLQRDWGYQIAPYGGGISHYQYPAKYGFDINAAPTCSDFVVFPVPANGSATQASIVGFNNLYDGSCPSSAPGGQPFAPTLAFAYDVGTGKVQSSPVLSLDGTKVAFMEFTPAGSIFHVLTLGTTGNNGTAYNSPVQPCTVNGTTSCTTNNAVDTSITMNVSFEGNPSSPFVDYANDIAYASDYGGTLHKFVGVFRGVVAEVTTGGWPFTGTSGNGLTDPVYDSISKHIFVGSGDGYLFCVDLSSGAPKFCGTSSVSLGLYGGIYDAPPMVDSTAQTVFAIGYYYNWDISTYQSTLLQTNTALANQVQVSIGFTIGSQHDGDFDNAYYSGNYASGYMYACGGGTSTTTGATLYRIGFDSSGKMNASNDGNSYQLASGAASCTPLTEVYNPSQREDFLFLGVNYGATPAGCGGNDCIMSFALPSPGGSFPTEPAAAYPDGPVSGIIIDNVSTQPGASEIYFSSINGNATQFSQNGLN